MYLNKLSLRISEYENKKDFVAQQKSSSFLAIYPDDVSTHK